MKGKGRACRCTWPGLSSPPFEGRLMCVEAEFLCVEWTMFCLF